MSIIRIAILIAASSAVWARAQSTQPATTSRAAYTLQKVPLPAGGFYWLKTPADYRKGDEAPLVVCLHGTDDPARGAVEFWSSQGMEQGAVWAAPQASGLGWAETDLVRLRETWADLQQRVTFDRRRVLLAGFSAGGAMAFHWLYVEGFPASAAVTLANYVPPRVTADAIAKQKQVPIFYGVGMVDINQERMLAGLSLLRDNGVLVRVHRPYIGHTLSPEVAEQAVAWFEEQCRQATQRQLDEAEAALRDGQRGIAARMYEDILAHRRWRQASDAQSAQAGLEQVQAWGRQRIEQAAAMAQAGEKLGAVNTLREVENAYAGSLLAEHAKGERLRLEADPAVRQLIAAQSTGRREREARDLLIGVQRLVAAGKFEEARQDCQTIVSLYGDTGSADRARRLLEKLPRRSMR